jgi:hypothetical protein
VQQCAQLFLSPTTTTHRSVIKSLVAVQQIHIKPRFFLFLRPLLCARKQLLGCFYGYSSRSAPAISRIMRDEVLDLLLWLSKVLKKEN